jgi:hypothetical protein
LIGHFDCDRGQRRRAPWADRRPGPGRLDGLLTVPAAPSLALRAAPPPCACPASSSATPRNRCAGATAHIGCPASLPPPAPTHRHAHANSGPDVLPWDALDARSWGDAGQLPPAELARVLAAYAARVLTPRGSTAVAGLELMSALRPPTRAVKDDATDTWVSGPVPGSLTEPVDPAYVEAPDEHPVVTALFPRTHERTPGEVLDEEAFDWIRETELLTDAECSKAFAVGVDVNTAFLAAANRLPVGLGGPEYVKAPRFDKAVPGSWLVDLSGIELDPRLPSPFTPHGRRPDGPAWYATPTVAYAAELIDTFRLPVELRPLEAYLRRDAGPYLDPWYKHLAEAYKATMADLGVTADLSPAAFLEAMAGHKDSDPGMAAVLSAIKSTVKGGIGKLRERPQGAKYRPGDRWPALERPTWRPDIRAAGHLGGPGQHAPQAGEDRAGYAGRAPHRPARWCSGRTRCCRSRCCRTARSTPRRGRPRWTSCPTTRPGSPRPARSGSGSRPAWSSTKAPGLWSSWSSSTTPPGTSRATTRWTTESRRWATSTTRCTAQPRTPRHGRSRSPPARRCGSC